MRLRDMLKLSLLQEIWFAGRRALLPPSVLQVLEWAYGNPGSKTAHRLLCHVLRIVNSLSVMSGTPSTLPPNAYKGAIDQAINGVIHDLHCDPCSDVDPADRAEIIALLV